MSFLGVGNIFTKLAYVLVFLKNHAINIGFQVVILSQHLKFSYFSFGLVFIAELGASDYPSRKSITAGGFLPRWD